MSLTGRTMCFHSHLPPIFKMCWSVRKPEYIWNKNSIPWKVLEWFLFTWWNASEKLLVHCAHLFGFFFYASQLVIKNLSVHTFHGIIFITPISDQNRISPYNIKQISDENKEKYQFRGLLVFIVVTTDFMIQVLKKYSNNIYH